MHKKILISTLLGASLSFATWGYFPLKESDSGIQVRANHFVGFGDSDPHYLNADVRYVIGTTLELALLNVGFQISDPAGLQNPVLSARLQLGQKSLLFAEGTIPIGQDAQEEFINLGYQHAFVLSTHFAWSTEASSAAIFGDNAEGNIEFKGVEVKAGTEMDFNKTPSLIWFVGSDLKVMASKGSDGSEPAQPDPYGYGYGGYGNSEGDDSATKSSAGLKIFGGASYELSPNMYLQEEVSLTLSIEGDAYENKSLAFRTSLKYSF